MPRATLDLQNPADLAAVGGQWKCAHGFVPGQPNEGFVSEAEGSPCRLPRLQRLRLGRLRRPDRLAPPGRLLRLVSHQGHPARNRGRPRPGRRPLPL